MGTAVPKNERDTSVLKVNFETTPTLPYVGKHGLLRGVSRQRETAIFESAFSAPFWDGTHLGTVPFLTRANRAA